MKEQGDLALILKLGERVNEGTAKATESQYSRNICVIFDYFRLIFLATKKMVSLLAFAWRFRPFWRKRDRNV